MIWLGISSMNSRMTSYTLFKKNMHVFIPRRSSLTTHFQQATTGKPRGWCNNTLEIFITNMSKDHTKLDFSFPSAPRLPSPSESTAWFVYYCYFVFIICCWESLQYKLSQFFIKGTNNDIKNGNKTTKTG